MKQSMTTPKEFTGRHMLIVMLLFFGVIISVNLVMAMYASSSWTGLVVKNSYVASQEFNEKAVEGREQAARQWVPLLELRSGFVSFQIQDRSGASIPLSKVSVTFRRPAYEAEDTTYKLTRQGDGAFGITVNILDGLWIVETSADFGGPHPYRDTKRVELNGGIAQ
jgi:nitrogen fixation protein FixH